MAFRRWQVAEVDAKKVDDMVAALGISRLAATVLIARGCNTPSDAQKMLDTDAPIEDPSSLKDIDKAVARIRKAIEEEERIAVFGDYDADGVTATALLVQYLMGSGADVICALPSRESTGYGLSTQAVDRLHQKGAQLIITVDNGISAYQEVEYASNIGIDVIVSDHHLPPKELPKAVAVVDPLRSDDESEFKGLAGVGVALKLAAAVEGCSAEELLEIYGDLAAIGTISDIMPLSDENRAIVAVGIEQLREGSHVGLAALCKACDIFPGGLNANKVAFVLAPRLNAAGRMGHAALALRLLLCEDSDEADKIAAQLIEINEQRKKAEDGVMKKIAEHTDADADTVQKPVVILAAQELHTGVTGIVCSRLSSRLDKPVIIISVEGGEGRGSGRSVPGFSLHAAIESCRSALLKYGGHDMAAGFTLNAAEINEFKEQMDAYCAEQAKDFSFEGMAVDAEVRIVDICEEEVEGLSILEPFGAANEIPVFCALNLMIEAVVPMGNRHSRVVLSQGQQRITGAVFGKIPEDQAYQKGDRVDVAFTLTMFVSERREAISIQFVEIRRAGLTDSDYASAKAYDRLMAGQSLEAMEKILLTPSREDIATVYRVLLRQRVDRFDNAAKGFFFPELPTGRVSVILDILEELNLISVSDIFSGIIQVARNPQKRDLSASRLYQMLHKEEMI